MRPSRKCSYICVIFGSVLVIAGILFIANPTNIRKYLLNALLTLSPNSLAYNLWKTTPVPGSLKCHFFNWTNPEDIFNSSIKPKFEEVGPYTFSEYRKKYKPIFNENDTVTYKQSRTWYYDKERSRNLTDNITSINVIATVS